MTVSVRSFRPSDRDAVLAILVDAFEGDPYFRRTTPLARRRSHRETIERMLAVQLDREYVPHGRIDVAVAEESPQSPLGVALWDTPTGGPGRIERLTEMAEWARLFGRNTPTAVLRDRAEAKFQPAFPHWYLYVLAVSPAAQGRGAGTALLNHGLERAGDEAVYLEATTADSARLYSRLGFVPMGLLPLHGGTGPHEIGMWKAPAVDGLDAAESK